MQSTIASTSKRPMEEQEEPEKKKKRVAAACDSCKRRKIRCDGQAACANCNAAGLNCTYMSTGLKKKGRPDSTVRALKAAQEAEGSLSARGVDSQAELSANAVSQDFSASASPASGNTPHEPSVVSFAPDVSLQTLASVASRPRRAKCIAELASRPTIELLVRLYFERMHPHMPIISPAPFWQSFKLEEDLTDHRFYSLLIALCSAVSVSMHGEEMPAELLSAYGSWEEVGRAFNAAVPPKRTRDMFADKRADVVQNIMLIVVYEKHVGSNIAMHLLNEAIRFAIAYHYDREDLFLPPAEAQIRKLIFFTLYQWSTYSSLLSGNPLAIRTDESHVSMPSQSNGAFAIPWNEEGGPDEEKALEAFNTSTSLCLAVEAAILAFHADMRASQRGIDVRPNFRQSIQTILSATEDAPTWLNIATTSSIDSTSRRSAALIYIAQQVSCIELYHRYQTLIAAEQHGIGQYHQARIAGQIATNLTKMSTTEINQLGPSAIDMLYHAREYLSEALAKLDDPSAFSQAKSDLKLLDAHLANVDSLRRVNAVVKRPRAYRPETSSKPSRASSPAANTPVFTSGELENALSPFNPAMQWNPPTFADPSIGSMAFMNNLPFLDVQNYAEASMAYAQSFWDNGQEFTGLGMQGQQFY